MNNRIFLGVTTFFGVLLTLGFLLISSFHSSQIVETAEKNYRNLFNSHLDRLVNSVRNDILFGNIRTARNKLAQASQDPNILNFRILSSDKLVMREQEFDGFRILIPVYFNDEGARAAIVMFDISSQPILELKLKMNKALLYNTLIVWFFFIFSSILFYILIWRANEGLNLHIQKLFDGGSHSTNKLALFFWSPALRILKNTSCVFTATRNEISKLKEHEALFKMARKVSHDIRAPVGLLKVVCDSESTLDDERIKTVLAKVAARIDNLASDLLVEARSNLGKTCQVVSLIGWLEDIVEEKRITYVDYKFTLTKKLKNGVICSNEYGFKAILSNLINNAVEASNVGDVINIVAESEENFCKITIQDKGHGISSSQISKIMNGEWSSKGMGNGLGISTSKNILESWGASLIINSELYEGTSVEINFPILLSSERDNSQDFYV